MLFITPSISGQVERRATATAEIRRWRIVLLAPETLHAGLPANQAVGKYRCVDSNARKDEESSAMVLPVPSRCHVWVNQAPRGRADARSVWRRAGVTETSLMRSEEH